jgi:hypothetical protein
MDHHPPYWSDVYPQGTAEGDEEFLFFDALSRHGSAFVSTGQLVRATGLSAQRVEELVEKYFNKGMIYPSEEYEDRWCYWERAPGLVPQPGKSLVEKDHEERIVRAIFDMGEDGDDS